MVGKGNFARVSVFRASGKQAEVNAEGSWPGSRLSRNTTYFQIHRAAEEHSHTKSSRTLQIFHTCGTGGLMFPGSGWTRCVCSNQQPLCLQSAQRFPELEGLIRTRCSVYPHRHRNTGTLSTQTQKSKAFREIRHRNTTAEAKSRARSTGGCHLLCVVTWWQEDPSLWGWDLQTLISVARHVESFRGPSALNNKAIQGKLTASYKALWYFGGPYRCFREALLNSVH